MKYVLLIHSDMALWRRLPKEEADRVLGNHYTLMDELKASGELIRVDGLSNERTFIEFRDGSPAVTDGPFGEVKEQLAGVFPVDVDSFERAKEIAGPALRVRRGRDPPVDGGCGHGDVSLPTLSTATPRPTSRTCSASWRRRSSPRSRAGTASSMPARTRCRRRCSRRRSNGRSEASRTTRAAG